MAKADPKSKSGKLRTLLRGLKITRRGELFYLSELAEMAATRYRFPFSSAHERSILINDVNAMARAVKYEFIPTTDAARIRWVLDKHIAGKGPALSTREIAAKVMVFDRKPRSPASRDNLMDTAGKIARAMGYQTKKHVNLDSTPARIRGVLAAAVAVGELSLTRQEVARRVVAEHKLKITKAGWRELCASVGEVAREMEYTFGERDTYTARITAVISEAVAKNKKLSVYEIADKVCDGLGIGIDDIGPSVLHARIWSVAKQQDYSLAPAKGKAAAIRSAIRRAKRKKEGPLTTLEIAQRASRILKINPIGEERRMLVEHAGRVARDIGYEPAPVVRKGRLRDQHSYFLLPPSPEDSLKYYLEKSYRAGADPAHGEIIEVVGDQFRGDLQAAREAAEIEILRKHAPKSILVRLDRVSPKSFSDTERQFVEQLMDAVLPPNMDPKYLKPMFLEDRGYQGINRFRFRHRYLDHVSREEADKIVPLLPLMGRCLYQQACRNTNGILDWYVAQKKRPAVVRQVVVGRRLAVAAR